MTSMTKRIRWMRKGSTCNPPKSRTPRATAANIIDRRTLWLPPAPNKGLSFGGVVAFAGQNPQVMVSGFDFHFAEFSVLRRVCRIVAQRILAAQFFRDFIEGLI